MVCATEGCMPLCVGRGRGKDGLSGDERDRGTHIFQLTSFMEFESVPLNWLLFRTTRETVPQPQHLLVSMLDMTSLIPPETGLALAASKSAQMKRITANSRSARVGRALEVDRVLPGLGEVGVTRRFGL